MINSKKRVRVRANWASDEDILKRLLLLYKTSENDVSNIEFVFDDSYEIIIFFGYMVDNIKPGAKAYVFPQEPSWSGGHQKYYENNPSLTVFGYDKHLYSPQERIQESMSYMFYGGRGPVTEGYDHWNYEFLTKNNFIKTKKISSVISGLGLDTNQNWPDGCIYRKRINLVNYIINNIDFIDIYSRGGEESFLKGDVRYKIDAIKDYKFSLCSENSNEKNYISEKFFDCILTNTVPIYYGCKNVSDLVPDKCFIPFDIDDVKDTIDILNFVNENCDKLYEEMLPHVLKCKEKYFSEFNLLKIVNNICS